MSIDEKIKELAERLKELQVSKGFIKNYPDDLKKEVLKLHFASEYSLNEFSKLIGKSTKTLRDWRIYFGFPKKESKYPNKHKMKEPETHVVKPISHFFPQPHERLKLSKTMTKLRQIQHHKIARVARADKSKNVARIIKVSQEEKNKDETVSNISYQIDEIIPIVVLRGDKISSKARKMQEDWLKKNKPTRSVYGQPWSDYGL